MPSPKERTIAQHLANEGVHFSEQLRDDNKWYFENLKATYFAIASAISLTWTKHALFDDNFITYAASYIDGIIPKDEQIATKYYQRFGSDELDNALTNYRRYYNHVKDLMPDFSNCDVQALNRLQQRLLNKLNTLRVNNIITGIGPWLFTGPFKIILSDLDGLWTQDGINAIILPTGMEVDRGIKKLQKEGYPFMKDFDPHWLEFTSPSLLDNYATYSMVHTYIVKVGQMTNTPALHINSALYLYGRNDI